MFDLFFIINKHKHIYIYIYVYITFASYSGELEMDTAIALQQYRGALQPASSGDATAEGSPLSSRVVRTGWDTDSTP